MIESYQVTYALPDDIPGLVILINSAYRGESSKKGWTTEADLLEGELRTDESSLDLLLQNPEAVILKCHDDKQLCGCVYLKKLGNKMYLGMLTVSPEIQAKGIGKKLLFASEKYAQSQGCNSIIMNVISVRHELIAWYERHGFKENGNRNPFPLNEKFGVPTQLLEFIELEKMLM